MQPHFEFEQVDPDNEYRLRVTLQSTGEALGVTYKTKGAGWVAEHAGLTGRQGAVHGFGNERLAAEFLYWFKAPEQSDRTNPIDRPRPLNPELLPKHGALVSSFRSTMETSSSTSTPEGLGRASATSSSATTAGTR